MKLYQIYEEDLQKLEHALPRLHELARELLNNPEVQVLFQEAKEIVSNVRWNYGPHSNVQRMDRPPRGMPGSERESDGE